MNYTQTEEMLSFSQAARSLPPSPKNRPVNISTIFRWATEGVRGIRLEAYMMGGRWYTTREALARFCERLTAQRLGVPSEAIAGTVAAQLAEARVQARGA